MRTPRATWIKDDDGYRAQVCCIVMHVTPGGGPTKGRWLWDAWDLDEHNDSHTTTGQCETVIGGMLSAEDAAGVVWFEGGEVTP